MRQRQFNYTVSLKMVDDDGALKEPAVLGATTVDIPEYSRTSFSYQSMKFGHMAGLGPAEPPEFTVMVDMNIEDVGLSDFGPGNLSSILPWLENVHNVNQNAIDVTITTNDREGDALRPYYSIKATNCFLLGIQKDQLDANSDDAVMRVTLRFKPTSIEPLQYLTATTEEVGG